MVLESQVPLIAGGGSLYEWSAGEVQPSERLQPLYVLPKGEGGDIVGGGAPTPSSYNHQLSNDGSVFFDYGGHLYLEDVVGRVSVRLDVAQQGVPEPSRAHAGFLYASSDGSRVLFSDPEQLTSAPGGGVYECRIAEIEGRPACAQLALTGISGEGRLIGGSEDASYLYFVGDADNLYVAHDGAGGWETYPIVTLSSEDSSDWGDPDGVTRLAYQTSRVSPNGEWLAFMSDRSLTGYDNQDAKSSIPDEEVYLYDAAIGKVVCASCDPTDARPVGAPYETGSLTGGWRVWQEGRWLAANVPGWTPYTGDGEALYQSHYLSNEGRLFFNSSDALVSQDTNGNEDVYEYEPVGVGSCEESDSTVGVSSGGCVSLISSGVAFGESAFLDASETGGDVFFTTAEKLVPQAEGNTLNVYDAHECSAQSSCPLPAPAASPECVSASACRAAPLAQPSIFGAPSSEAVSGTGNVISRSMMEQSAGEGKSGRSLSRAQKLADALRACGKERPKRKRAACERQARKRYGPVKSSKASAKRRVRK